MSLQRWIQIAILQDHIQLENYGHFKLLLQQCVQDLMDGFFPSELQKKYPDGVPIEVSLILSSHTC